MSKPTFSRKLVRNKESLQVTVPAEIVKVLKLKAGDSLVFSYENGSFTCSKRKSLAD
ncbi:MAG: AbrB/MazE/SpoVT family DNA-binding domain-containing protein [Candidatus Heimdallarchaeota archaeon]